MGAFTRHVLDTRAGAAPDLGTLAGLELDAVNGRAHRNVAQGEAVAHLNRRIRTRA